MVAKQRIRMANEKHSKNITQRGNVAKTSVRKSGHPSPGRDPGGQGPRRDRGRGEFSPDSPVSTPAAVESGAGGEICEFPG